MTTGPGRTEIPLGVICASISGVKLESSWNNLTTGPGRTEIPLGVICASISGVKQILRDWLTSI